MKCPQQQQAMSRLGRRQTHSLQIHHDPQTCKQLRWQPCRLQLHRSVSMPLTSSRCVASTPHQHVKALAHHHKAGFVDIASRIMPRALTLVTVAVFSAAAVPPCLQRMGAPALPARLLHAAAALAPHWKAIALQRAVRRLARMHARRRKARIVKGTTDGLLERAALERATAPASSPALLRDMTLQELCSYFNTELQEIKRLLLPSLQLPVARWDRSNSELMRFAVSCGMLEVAFVCPMYDATAAVLSTWLLTRSATPLARQRRCTSARWPLQRR